MTSLPELPKDATDRNRTSPFAFTGNKFEFRAVGSSAPIYWPQTVLNTAVADSLRQLADELDKLEAGDFAGLTRVLSEIVRGHKQVLFEGNGYSEAWHAEAARRGLPNNRTTVDALPALTTDKAIALFSSFGVLSERELRARADINWERYVKVQNIEAMCSLDIARTMILPAAVAYLGRLGAAGSSKGVAHVRTAVEGFTDTLVERIHALEHAVHEAHEAGSVEAEARVVRGRRDPGAERTARDRRHARDAGGRRPVAAAQVPRAAVPVLSSRVRAAGGRGPRGCRPGPLPGSGAGPRSGRRRPRAGLAPASRGIGLTRWSTAGIGPPVTRSSWTLLIRSRRTIARGAAGRFGPSGGPAGCPDACPAPQPQQRWLIGA